MEDDFFPLCAASPCKPHLSPCAAACSLNSSRKKAARRRSGRLQVAKLQSKEKLTQKYNTRAQRGAKMTSIKEKAGKKKQYSRTEAQAELTRCLSNKCFKLEEHQPNTELPFEDYLTENINIKKALSCPKEMLDTLEPHERLPSMKHWVGPLYQSFKSKMASITDMVMTPVRFFKSSPTSVDSPTIISCLPVEENSFIPDDKSKATDKMEMELKSETVCNKPTSQVLVEDANKQVRLSQDSFCSSVTSSDLQNFAVIKLSFDSETECKLVGQSQRSASPEAKRQRTVETYDEKEEDAAFPPILQQSNLFFAGCSEDSTTSQVTVAMQDSIIQTKDIQVMPEEETCLSSSPEKQNVLVKAAVHNSVTMESDLNISLCSIPPNSPCLSQGALENLGKTRKESNPPSLTSVLLENMCRQNVEESEGLSMSHLTSRPHTSLRAPCTKASEMPGMEMINECFCVSLPKLNLSVGVAGKKLTVGTKDTAQEKFAKEDQGEGSKENGLENEKKDDLSETSKAGRNRQLVKKIRGRQKGNAQNGLRSNIMPPQNILHMGMGTSESMRTKKVRCIKLESKSPGFIVHNDKIKDCAVIPLIKCDAKTSSFKDIINKSENGKEEECSNMDPREITDSASVPMPFVGSAALKNVTARSCRKRNLSVKTMVDHSIGCQKRKFEEERFKDDQNTEKTTSKVENESEIKEQLDKLESGTSKKVRTAENHGKNNGESLGLKMIVSCFNEGKQSQSSAVNEKPETTSQNCLQTHFEENMDKEAPFGSLSCSRKRSPRQSDDTQDGKRCVKDKFRLTSRLSSRASRRVAKDQNMGAAASSLQREGKKIKLKQTELGKRTCLQRKKNKNQLHRNEESLCQMKNEKRDGPAGGIPLPVRLMRSRSCPEISSLLLEQSVLPHTPHIRPSPGSSHPHPSTQHPSPGKRTRRHTVCSLEVEREVAPLCLRKEVFPAGLYYNSTSLTALASSFLSSPLALLSQKHDESSGDLGFSACNRDAKLFRSCGSSSSPCASALSCHLVPRVVLDRTKQGSASLSSDYSFHSQSLLEGGNPERLQMEEEDENFALNLEGCEAQEDRVLLDSDVKMDSSKQCERGKVSRIRIRKTAPKPLTNLTPMGLPKPVRLKKREFTVEEIYTNKNFRKPPEGRLETIFEVPVCCRNGSTCLIGPRRLRRIVEFPEVGIPRKPRRPLVGSGTTGSRKAGRPRRGGSQAKDSLALSPLEVDSMLRAKLDQLDSWIAIHQAAVVA